jgi:hypothetical protein
MILITHDIPLQIHLFHLRTVVSIVLLGVARQDRFHQYGRNTGNNSVRIVKIEDDYYGFRGRFWKDLGIIILTCSFDDGTFVLLLGCSQIIIV